MLRMDGFQYHHAQTPEEAVALWHAHDDATYIAGGTDLLPNIKHRIVNPRHLIGLGSCLPTGCRQEDDQWIIGAGTSLTDLSKLTQIPPLAQAADLVASPQIRNMGTLGGNVLLDTRCLYYNQTAFWREALGYCLKCEGTWCHVIGSERTCVAAQSSDTVPVLLAMNASLQLQTKSGEKSMALRDLYHFRGQAHLKLEPGDLLTEVVIPKPAANFRGCYQKLRTRDSIDFPQLGLAICGCFDGDTPLSLDIVVGAASPQPKPVKGLDAFLGSPLDDETIDAIAEKVYQHAHPQGALRGAPDWRRHMAATFTRRGLNQLKRG